jgi:hypothetical protein
MTTVKPKEYMGIGEFKFDEVWPKLPDYMRLPQFSLQERIALHQEIYGARHAIMDAKQRVHLPDQGETMVGMLDRLGIDPAQTHEVAISPRGEVYTPGEFQALRAVIGPLFKEAGMEVSIFRIPTFAETNAVVRFRATMDKFLKDALRYASDEKYPYFGKQFTEFGIKSTRRQADPVSRKTGLQRAEEYAQREADMRQTEAEIAYEAFKRDPYDKKAKRAATMDAIKRGVRAKQEAKRAAKKEAGARRRSRKRTERYEDWYQREGRKTGSATLDEALAGFQRPTRKNIDDIHGRPAAEGGLTTLQTLKKVWDELGIEGKKPRSIKELRRKIKANLADKELLQPMRKGQYIPAHKGRVKPANLREKWDGIDEHIAQMHELDFEHLRWDEEQVGRPAAEQLTEVGEEWFHPEKTREDLVGMEELDFDPRYDEMNRGFRGQRGAIDPDLLTFGLASKLGRKKGKMKVEDFDPSRKAYRMVDPIIRRWYKHAQENPDWRPEQQNFRDHKDSAWRVTKEVLGGHPLTPVWNKAAGMYEKGYTGLHELLSMIEVLPRQRWITPVKGILAWHQVRQMRMGEWLTSERTASKSFQNVLNQIESKWFTGPRKAPNMLGRFGKHFPAGLNMHNIPLKLVKATKADLTTGKAPTTYAGQLMRQYLDRLYSAAKQVGVPVAEYVDGYLPPVFKYREMINDKMPLRAKFRELARKKGLDDAVVDEWLLSVINGEGLVRVRPEFREGRQINLRDPNLELQRRFLQHFTVEELGPFLIDDVFVSTQKYATDVVTRMAEVERFGAQDQYWNRALDRAATQAEKAGAALTVDDLKRITDMRLIMRHMYGESVPHLKELLRVGYGIESWSKLGMVVPGSLSELGLNLNNPLMWKEYSKALVVQGVPEMARTVARGVYRDLPRSRAFELASDTGRVASIMMHEHLTALNAADQGSVWSSLAFVANGLHPMTQGMVTATVGGFERAVHRVAKAEGNLRLNRWKPKRGERDLHEYDKKMIEYYGLDVEEVIKWQRDGAKMDGPWYQTKMVPAMLKAANDGVLTPRGTNLPRWMAKTSLGPLRYLYTYVTMLGNKITPEIAHMLQGGMLDGAPASPTVRWRNRVQGAGAMASILALAVLSEELRDYWLHGGSENRPGAKKMNEEEEMMDKIVRYISRTGFLGFAGAKVMDMLESGLHGRLDSGKVIENVIGSLYTDAARGGAVMWAGAMGDLSAKQLALFMMNISPMQTALPRGHKAPAGKQLNRKEIQKAWEDYFVAMGMRRGGRTKGTFSSPSVWK